MPGAIGIHQHAGISFRDSMIVHSATEMGCAVLYSEDFNADQTQADAFSALTRPGGPGSQRPQFQRGKRLRNVVEKAPSYAEGV